MPDKPDWKTPVRYEKYDDGSEAIWDADGTLIYSIPATHTIDLRMLCVLGRRDLEGVANCVNEHDRLKALAEKVIKEDGSDGVLIILAETALKWMRKFNESIDDTPIQVQIFIANAERILGIARQLMEAKDDATTDTD